MRDKAYNVPFDALGCCRMSSSLFLGISPIISIFFFVEQAFVFGL